MHLLKRTVTAIPLLAILVWLLVFASDDLFMLVAFVVTLAISFEWAMVTGIQKLLWRIVYVLVQAVVLAIFYFGYADQIATLWLQLVALFWLVSVFVGVPFWQKLYKKMFANTTAGLFLGLFILTGFGLALAALHSYNVWLLMILILSCIMFDSFAYFAGKWKGQHKLCPTISPGKTWEGVIGGSAAAICTSAVVIVLLVQQNLLAVEYFFPWFGLSLFAVFFGIFGDLVESVLKRVKGLDDSSTILPGHGGLLDRFDSYFAALPVCACILSLFGI